MCRKKGVVNTISMTAEEKKAMRAEIDKKKKAAKKRKAEEDRKRRLVEEAERARIAALEFLGARAKEWTPWATITHFAVDLQGFVSVDGERAAPANIVRTQPPLALGCLAGASFRAPQSMPLHRIRVSSQFSPAKHDRAAAFARARILAHACV